MRYRNLSLLLLLVLLVGCSEISGLFSSTEEAPVPGAFVQPTPEPTFPAEMTTAARIEARGELVVGVRYDLEPFSYVTPDSQLAGLEIDLAHQLAERWLGSPDAVRFRQVRSDTALTHLADGTVDLVLAGVVHTQEAEAQVDFGPPYFDDGMALLTFPDTGVQSLADLEGKRVGVLGWTDSQQQLESSVTVSITTVTFDHFFDVVAALQGREIDVYADHRHRLERARRTVGGTQIVGGWTYEPFAAAFRQDDPFFANLVRLTFEDMVRDGTRDALYARWLPDTSPPAVATLPGAATVPPLDASPAQLSTLDVVARIRERGTVALGYFQDRWPYSADRADGVPTGFEVRLLQRLAELWLGSREAVTFVPLADEADGLARLARGEVDLLAGDWAQSRERELQVDQSLPILDDGVSLFSLAEAPATDLAALTGQPIGVVVGSSAEAAVPELARRYGLTTQGYPTFQAAVEALHAGEIVAILSERRPALFVHFQQTGYAVTDQRYTYRPVGYVLPQGDSAFRDLVNLSLMALEQDGVYQELYSVWFDDPVPELERWPGGPAVPLVIGQ